MKFTILILLISFLFVEVKGQINPVSEDVQGNTSTGIYPLSPTMPRGGQEKTASGTLKVLVIFVRYLR